jgi:hypothetical protein
MALAKEGLMAKGERALIARWWDEAWDEGLWAASWEKSVAGLTARQAAWRPRAVKGERHSIWQLVLHMIFWRESWLRRAATGVRPSGEEVQKFNFPKVSGASPAAWSAALKRFKKTQKQVGKALRTLGPNADPMIYFLPHDCYHFGQINMLRGMQGLKPIE